MTVGRSVPSGVRSTICSIYGDEGRLGGKKPITKVRNIRFERTRRRYDAVIGNNNIVKRRAAPVPRMPNGEFNKPLRDGTVATREGRTRRYHTGGGFGKRRRGPCNRSLLFPYVRAADDNHRVEIYTVGSEKSIAPPVIIARLTDRRSKRALIVRILTPTRIVRNAHDRRAYKGL